jgi:hypothetical protein
MATITTARRKPATKPEEKKPEAKGKTAQKRDLGATPAYIQRKLAVGSSHDPAESAADQVADHVVARKAESAKPAASTTPGPKPPVGTSEPQVKRKEVDANGKLEAAKKQEKEQQKPAAALQRSNAPSLAGVKQAKEAAKEEKRELIQSKSALPHLQRQLMTPMDQAGGVADPEVERRLDATRGGGAPLDAATRQHLEASIGHDFRNVRLHTDAQADALARDLGAKAFTVGNDIYFAAGTFDPSTTAGTHLLSHELTHVVQQGAAPVLHPGAAGSPTANAVTGGGGAAATTSGAAVAHQPTMPAPQAQPLIQGRLIQRGLTPGGTTAGATLSQGEITAARAQTLAQGQLTGAGEQAAINFASLDVPAFKASGLTNLRRSKRFTGSRATNGTNQGDHWRTGMAGAGKDGLKNRVADIMQLGATSGIRKAVKAPARTRTLGVRMGDTYVIGTPAEIAEQLILPMWNGAGTPASMELDHIKEMQISGFPGPTDADSFANLWLLERGVNSEVGNTIKRNIRSRVEGFLTALGRTGVGAGEVDATLSAYDLTFATATAADNGTYTVQASWSRDQITAGRHLDREVIGNIGRIPTSSNRIVVTDINNIGEPNQVAIFRQANGGRRKLFSQPTPGGAVGIGSDERSWIRGFVLTAITYPVPVAGATTLGNMEFTVGPNFTEEGQTKTVPIRPIAGFSGGGWIDLSADLRGGLHYKKSSPAELSELVDVAGDQISPRFTVTTDVPFLRDMVFALEMGPRDSVIVSAEIAGDQIQLPAPFHIEACTLRLFASSEREFGVEGLLAFAIDQVGRGELRASTSTASVFNFDGWFDFESETFTQARIEAGYHDGEWTLDGILAIGEGKLRGVRSANLHVRREAGRLSADGRAQFTIPGVAGADITATHSDVDGFVITAGVDLAASTALRSGRITITVRKHEGTWKVAASGTAVPNIPGVSTVVTVAYDDGTFSAETTIDYARGRLAGTITIGVTNAPLGDDGRPTGTAAEDGAEPVVYGGGSLTIQISPWLAGTAGVRVLPNGEIEVHGRVAVPQPVTMFAARRWDRTLASVGLDIPIFGVAVAGQRIGIFCTIGGSLKVEAGIGPAQINDIALEVTYNPAHEDQAHVVGTAGFHMPADAGLKLAAHAAIGAGIPVVSAQAGLEIAGVLGVVTALDLPLTVDWTPTSGLTIDAPISLSLQPVFTFSVNGYVLVEADLLLTTIELYRQDWNLASLAIGSGYTVGMTMPFHYAEGQPFNPSLDDIQLTYPTIEPMDVLSSVFDRIV